MKKISIWYVAAILVALLLFVSEAVIAQNNSQEKLASDRMSLQTFFQEYQSIRGRTLVAGDSVTIQSLNVLQEPVFTSGVTNVIRWEVPQEPITFTLNGQLVDVIIDSCSAVIYARANGNQILKVVPVTDGSVQFDFNDPAWIGTTITYSCFLGISYNFKDYLDETSETTTSSYQDNVQPTVGSLIVDGPGKNGWLTTNNFNIKYVGLQDIAAIFSVKLTGDINVADSSFFNFDPLNPLPTQIDTGEFNINLQDGGPYSFDFTACDAAYDASMPPRNPNATWILDSNCAPAILSGEVKIDTKSPEIDTSQIPSVYNPKYKNYNSGSKSLTITFPIYDELSHIDPKSVNNNTITFEPALPFEYNVLPASFNQAQDTCYVTILVSSITSDDVESTLIINVEDMAGNPAHAQKLLRFNFKPSEITAFQMVDPNIVDTDCIVPDAQHADESRMLFRSFAVTDDDVVQMQLEIKIDEVTVGFDTVDFPGKDGFVISDPLDSLGIEMPDDGSIMSVTLAAIDRDGNIQPVQTRETRSITFDRTISDISVSVVDTSKWDGEKPEIYGAYAGWTNDNTVLVNLDSPDNDWYKLHETSPEDTCYDNPEKQFLRQLPDGPDRKVTFSYQVGDVAGNASNRTSDEIKLDTEAVVLDSSHIKIFDPETLSELSTSSINVNITLKLENLPTDHNTSRMVINDVLYYVDSPGDTLTVPVNNGNFTISIIDYAGNMSNQIEQKIVVEPVFEFVLFDFQEDTTNMSGWTDEAEVRWDYIHDKYTFDLEDVEELIFYDKDTTNSVVLKPNDAKIIDLSQLYTPLISGEKYEVKSRVVLINGSKTPGDKLKSAFISYDNVRPEIETVTLADVEANPREAEAGFTNQFNVKLFTEASDEHSGVDSIRISGDGISIADSTMPNTVRYENELELVLADKSSRLFTAQIAVAVQDVAGNWSGPGEEATSIVYLNQNIIVEPEVSTFEVAETDTALYLFSMNVTCDFHDDLAYAEITRPDAQVAKIPATEFVSDGTTGTMRNYKLPLTDVIAGDGYSIVVVDKGGNASDSAQFNVDIIRPPKISLTLYDVSEFASKESEFTDALNEEGKILAVVTRDSSSGLWENLELMWSDTTVTISMADKDPYYFEYEINIDTSNIVDCYIHVEAEASNQRFPSNYETTSILHDTTRPSLTDFNLIPENEPEQWKVDIQANDGNGCQSGVAGAIIKDETVDSGDVVWYYCPYDEDNYIELKEESGLHRLTAYVVDKADVDQTVGALNDTEENIVAALVGKDGRIDHESASMPIEKWVLANIAYNFPNPFNPEEGETRIQVPSKDASSVELRIFDLFGNLVYEDLDPEKSADDSDNFIIIWDGCNGHGDIVASGTYLAIIKPDNGDVLEPIKIGVLRKRGL